MRNSNSLGFCVTIPVFPFTIDHQVNVRGVGSLGIDVRLHSSEVSNLTYLNLTFEVQNPGYFDKKLILEILWMIEFEENPLLKEAASVATRRVENLSRWFTDAELTRLYRGGKTYAPVSGGGEGRSAEHIDTHTINVTSYDLETLKMHRIANVNNATDGDAYEIRVDAGSDSITTPVRTLTVHGPTEGAAKFRAQKRLAAELGMKPAQVKILSCIKTNAA